MEKERIAETMQKHVCFRYRLFALRSFPNCHKDREQFAALLQQDRPEAVITQRSQTTEFQPINRFRCFFLGDVHLAYEIGAARGAIGLAVVGADRGRRAQHLAPDHIPHRPLRQG